mmetsp:Transcript_2098/g.1912  ORF Transcript_2098/g.1912 Transcript_2098/m.1912 type:complete len:235 (-) Transcript_2098:380-1084(-)
MTNPKFSVLLLAMMVALSYQSYDESTGKLLWTYSSLSYCSDSVLQQASCDKCSIFDSQAIYLHQYSSVNSVIDDSVSYSMFVDHDNQYLVAAFRGTNTDTQLLQEGFTEEAVKYDLHSINGNPYVMSFFYSAYKDNLRSDFLSNLEDYINEYSGYTVVITGHSLGAALATHAALDIVLSGYVDSSNIIFYNYGCPRVGTYDFASAVEQNVPTLFRVVHYKDMVPHVPPCDYSAT